MGSVDSLARLVASRGFVLAALAALLAGCASHPHRSGYAARHAPPSSYAPHHFYPPPGAPGDPWGPYVQEAAARFRIPEAWIRAVMRQESGGQEQAVSSAGAMGLMQVMPATFEELRQRHALGPDPFAPRDNIMAGAAYIREMFDRFGAPGFLAAYNAGPDRLDQYMAGSASLPDETVHYVEALAPQLGTQVAMVGPLSVYAGKAGGPAPMVADAAPPPSPVSFAAGCDPDAAFDPDRPCRELVRQAQTAAAPVVLAPVALAPAETYAAASAPLPPPRPFATQSALYLPAPTYAPPRYAATPASPPSLATRPAAMPPGWEIQVGAFDNPGLAQAVAEGARAEAREQLAAAAVRLLPTTPFGHTILYRARLTSLSAGDAGTACNRLNARQLPCIVIPPGSAP